MTVNELIIELNKIENKELTILVNDCEFGQQPIDEIILNEPDNTPYAVGYYYTIQ